MILLSENRTEPGVYILPQHEITKRGPLHNVDGTLAEKGFAKHLLLSYDRERIKASKLRIKEWDYYLIASDRYALALTVADNGYMSMDSISLLDFDGPWEKTVSKMGVLPLGKRHLPSTSEKGDIAVKGKEYEMTFQNPGESRRLYGHMDNFKDGKTLLFDITLTGIPDESMVIATPFKDKPKAFYYNQKINCMKAEGKVILGEEEYLFAPAHSSAVLDWGRGVWTYKNTWYWGSLSGEANGKPFGFNIGYGFGDTNAASENMLFYDGKAHKLSQVTFNIPMKDGREDYLSPWTFTSDDGRFEMDFVPVLDRSSKMDFVILGSNQHQVFGRFSGKAVLDDGTEVRIRNLLGFAEKVFNKW